MGKLGVVKINGYSYIRPVIKVAVIDFDGAKCTVPVRDLLDMIDDGNEYKVTIKEISKAKFDRMPEFNGW